MKRTASRLVLLTVMTASGSSCLAAADPAADNFWERDDAGRITHQCAGDDPVVMCMQGRKVVMQVQVDATKGLSYTARFFNVQRDPMSLKRVVFDAGSESVPGVRVDGRAFMHGLPLSVIFDGLLIVAYPEREGIVVTRTVYPSTNKALIVEEWKLRNSSGRNVTVTVAPARRVKPVEDEIAIVWSCEGVPSAAVEPGGVLSFSTSLQAGLAVDPDMAFEVVAERAARRALAEAAWRGPGRLETPEPALDLAYALQKLHVLECPIETHKGLITHNGSLRYSPGIWANDPVEYSSPVFPFFGDPDLNRAGMGMYRVWQDYCQEHGIVPFPGSFEGPALKLTQRERGDDAMVLYGLSKFLLFQGDRAAAVELWPLIELSAASVLKHTTSDGIIASETDEMEDRYPTGAANLSTSALAYGGYRQAASLARAMGKPVAAEFDRRAEALRKAIDSCFGAEIEGFDTYRYYKENTTLRGWILLPLAMGITERQDGTVAALLSDKLWPKRMEGADILAESTRQTEWGRETYYALRVLFKAGRTEEALDLTRRVLRSQVFGKKGPYPDEDAIDMLCPGSLYPRVFTEGMFGIVPTGLDSFECTPWLPKDWPRMALRDVRAFGQAWDLVVERDGGQQKVTVRSGGRTVMTGSGPAGKTYPVTFAKQAAGDAVPELKSTLLLEGAAGIREPYPVLHGGAFGGPVVKESPDPLVAYRWKDPKASDPLQIYFLQAVAAVADEPDSFANLASATTRKTDITVKGAGSIRLDFGVESGAWVEFDSPDCPGEVEMSISEYNEPGFTATRATPRPWNVISTTPAPSSTRPMPCSARIRRSGSTGGTNGSARDSNSGSGPLRKPRTPTRSPFNQYFLIRAMARVGKHDEALSSVRDMWGGMLRNGATTTYEVFRPSWNEGLEPNDPVPNSQSGLTSLCHPWGAGVVKWLNEEVLGIVPTQPGFKTYDILPHPGRTLTQVSGETPTPLGGIRADFDFASGRGSISAPEGTIGRLGIPKLEKSIARITINGKLAWDGAYHAVPGIGGAGEDAEFVMFTAVQPGDHALEVVYEGETPAYDEAAVEYAAESLEADTTTGGDWGGALSTGTRREAVLRWR